MRHQLAWLLVSAGHEVVFCVKPRYPWQSKSLPMVSEQGIRLCQHQELLHHLLRITPLLRRTNAWWTRRSIRRIAGEYDLGTHDVIVNFNYEYYFLRDLFPASTLITIINDDFTVRAFRGFRRPLEQALRLTCEVSDRVLAVSTPLQTHLSQYCSPELFLPWAQFPYRTPEKRRPRDTLLFWGYISQRVDYEFVFRLADRLRNASSPIRLLFVGPVENSERSVDLLRLKPGIEVAPAAKLEDLPLDRVLAGFIPYRQDLIGMDAVMLPNKAMSQLAWGLPLLITGMPHFIKAPFVFPLVENSALQTIRYVQEHFDDLQPSIRDFVSENSAQARLEQFMSFASLSRATGDRRASVIG